MNPVEIAALDALDLLVVVDNESDTLSKSNLERLAQWPVALKALENLLHPRNDGGRTRSGGGSHLTARMLTTCC